MEQTTAHPTALLITDAAALVGVPAAKVYSAIASGDLAATSRVVVDPDELLAWHGRNAS